MARTYRTLSLSLPQEVVAQLERVGRNEGKTAARIAVDIVTRDIGMATRPVESEPYEEGDKTVLYQCIVHEPTRPGMFSREYQTISLLDIARIRGGKVSVLDVFLGGRWLEIEGDFDSFRQVWEAAKVAAGRPNRAEENEPIKEVPAKPPWTHQNAYGMAEIATVWNETKDKYAHQVRLVTANGRTYKGTRADRIWNDDVTVDDVVAQAINDLIMRIIKRG